MVEVRERTATDARLVSHSFRGLLTALLVHKTESAVTQVFRSMLAGVLAMAVDMGTLYVLHHRIGWDYRVAAALGFTVGLVVCYTLSVRWIFPARSISNRAMEFVLFCVIGVIGMGLTLAIMHMCHEWLHVSVMWSKVVAAVIVFGWNFAARRLFMFRPAKV